VHVRVHVACARACARVRIKGKGSVFQSRLKQLWGGAVDLKSFSLVFSLDSDHFSSYEKHVRTSHRRMRWGRGRCSNPPKRAPIANMIHLLITVT